MAKSMAIAAAAFLIASGAFAVSLTSGDADDSTAGEFEEYVAAYNRAYRLGSDEYHLRRSLFHERLQTINAHNARPDRLWTAGLNDLTDQTEDELAQLKGWVRGVQNHALLETTPHHRRQPLPDTVDWRNLTGAQKAPLQGSCGSCWAMATVSMLEAHWEIKSGRPGQTFSAQQLVNCVQNPLQCGGEGGCEGATVELAMQYVSANGLSDERTEPYTAKATTCMQATPAALGSLTQLGTSMPLHHTSGVGRLRSWKTLPSNKAEPLMKAVLEGPVAISIAAGGGMHSYMGGIFNSCQKDAIINHAVVLFGYGRENASPGVLQTVPGQATNYWIVRNSWGASWGEAGFFRIFRHATPAEDDKFCGIDTDPKQGIACREYEGGPYPDNSTVCGMCGMLFDSVQVELQVQPPLAAKGTGVSNGVF